MKQKLLIGVHAFAHGLCLCLAWVGLCCMAVACSDDDPNAEREDAITVYTDLEEEPIDIGYLDARGGETVLYVKSAVEFDVFWQDNATSPWVEVMGCTYDATLQAYKVSLNVAPRSTTPYYTRRGGTLSLVAPSLNLGKFIPLYQGAVARVSQAFGGFAYGSNNPYVTDGEREIANWSTVQKGYGWTSTVGKDAEKAYCYAKNGYLKLGDDVGHGADLITPYTNELRNDSLLMVSFRAVAYTSEEGTKDDGTLTVSILGGGVFQDTGLTTRTVSVDNFDPQQETFPTSMWNNSNYLLFVVSTEKNPITSSTQIRFMSGDIDLVDSVNHRVYIDNVYIHTLNEYNMNFIEQNQGSDRDKILGATE